MKHTIRFDEESVESFWERVRSVGMSRREFLALLASGGAAAVLSACAPMLAPTAAPLRPTRPILQNENRPGFFVRYYKPFPAPDPAAWTLSVTGLVRRPQNLSLADVQSLPSVAQVSRLKCVECWSAPAKWEGFHFRSLLQLVEPMADAKWIHFYCADDYSESLYVEELLLDRVLFAHRMNDAFLPDVYGAPLRLVFPPKYGYKGPKAITRLVFAQDELIGYWSRGGRYSTEGDIEPGVDHPLDLAGTRRIIGGEVKYPEGIESK